MVSVLSGSAWEDPLLPFGRTDIALIIVHCNINIAMHQNAD
jgi:hypothetical protein